MTDSTPKRKTTVVIDTYGGQSAPGAIVAAAARMARQGVARVVLVGDVTSLQDKLSLVPYDPMTLRIEPVPVPHPRHQGDTAAQIEAARIALPIAMELLNNGEADALITASPADLVFSLAEAYLPLLPHVRGLAAAAVFPTLPRQEGGDPLGLLLDVSGRRLQHANSLVEFAVLGAAYARIVTGIAEPKVALLSTGRDPQTGPAEVVRAHPLLRHRPGMQLVGNLQATDISRGLADVVVADGLVGHTVRGLLEGLTTMTVEAARYAWRTRVAWRVGLRLLSQGVGMLRKVSEFQQYGGAPILGLQHLVLGAHPDSGEGAFENALKLAARCHARGLQVELGLAAETLADLPSES